MFYGVYYFMKVKCYAKLRKEKNNSIRVVRGKNESRNNDGTDCNVTFTFF